MDQAGATEMRDEVFERTGGEVVVLEEQLVDGSPAPRLGLKHDFTLCPLCVDLDDKPAPLNAGYFAKHRRHRDDVHGLRRRTDPRRAGGASSASQTAPGRPTSRDAEAIRDTGADVHATVR